MRLPPLRFRALLTASAAAACCRLIPPVKIFSTRSGAKSRTRAASIQRCLPTPLSLAKLSAGWSAGSSPSFRDRLISTMAGGARPVPLAFPGAEHAITSDAFMELEDLPKRIVMVGGGYIAAEFSHIAARAGAKVTGCKERSACLRALTPSSWIALADGRDAIVKNGPAPNQCLVQSPPAERPRPPYWP